MAGIAIEHVVKRFGDVTVVDDVSIEVIDGEFLVMLGPSGCGKTTTLRMIAGLEELTSGDIRIGGKPVAHLPPRDCDIAMVFQSYALYPHMNVYDNLAFGMRARGSKKGEVDKQVRETADILGLAQLLKRRPAELSGGQRQRVALGRALIRQPQAFLMDEPLSNLDAGLRVQMRAELSRLHRRFQVTTVYVTHDQVEAMTMGDRIAVMNGGRLQQVDTPEAIYDNPANLFVAGFIGSPRMNFVPGRISSDGGELVLTFLGTSVKLDRKQLSGDVPGGDVTVGVRPEDLMWRSAAGAANDVVLTAEVDVVEPMGHEAYVTAVCTGQTVIARFPPRSGVRTHERIELVLNPARLHFFDAKTGESVLRRPVANTADAGRSAKEARMLDAVEADPDSQGQAQSPRVQGDNIKKLRGGTA